MSEASQESADAGTAQVEDGSQGTETDPESSVEEGQAPESGNDPAAELAHWKEMSRRNEKRARENSKAASELAALKQSQMSEAERIQAERDEAIRERDEAKADHARVMAAATHDLPVELIDYLGSGTDEEISERAEVIAGAIETRAQEIAETRVQEMSASGGGRNGFQGARPVESLRAGSAPSGSSEPRTSDEWFRSLYQR